MVMVVSTGVVKKKREEKRLADRESLFSDKLLCFLVKGFRAVEKGDWRLSFHSVVL